MEVLSSNAINCRVDIIYRHSSKQKNYGLTNGLGFLYSLVTRKDSPNALVKCIIQIIIIPSLDRETVIQKVSSAFHIPPSL